MLNGIDLDAEERLSAPPKEEAHLWMLVNALDTTNGDNVMRKRWVKKDKPTLEFEEDQKIKRALEAKRRKIEEKIKHKKQIEELKRLEAQELEFDLEEEQEIAEMKSESIEADEILDAE